MAHVILKRIIKRGLKAKGTAQHWRAQRLTLSKVL
jgi:hypothetical protein